MSRWWILLMSLVPVAPELCVIIIFESFFVQLLLPLALPLPGNYLQQQLLLLLLRLLSI